MRNESLALGEPQQPPNEHSLRKRMTLLGSLVALAIFGPGYLPPFNPTLNYQMDRTKPEEYFFDYLVRPAPRIIMELEASGKLTHDPDWVPTTVSSPNLCLTLEGDSGLLHRENFFQGRWFELNKLNWSKVQISLGAWWQVFQLKPADPEVSNWVLKFTGIGQDSGQRLRLRIVDEVKILQGDQNYLACGEDGYDNGIELEKRGPVPRKAAPVEGMSV